MHANGIGSFETCKHKLMTDQLLEHFTFANAIVANMYVFIKFKFN